MKHAAHLTHESPLSSSTARSSRRGFLAQSSAAVAVSALSGVRLPWVHAAEDQAIRLALIGCGGRGTGAAANALEVPGTPTRLVAMADLFGERLANSHRNLAEKFGGRIDVPPERRFLGFDAYRRAIDSLRKDDVAILTTHAAFRPGQLEYAIQKGVHVFMEKSFAPDPGSLQRVLRLAEAAEKKNLKIGCGLMCRHSSARQAMIQKIRDGAMGEIQLIRAYRMDPGARMGPWRGNENELLWQIRHPYFFYWASSGWFIEMMIHQVDECCWIKDAWPISAHGMGGRSPDSTDCSQNLDTYSIEYTFADGTKAMVSSRAVPNCHNDFATYVHGTKVAGQFSGNIHAPTVYLCKDQRVALNNVAWRPEKETISPYDAEWRALLDAIREDKPHNEVKRAALANLVADMGRAAVHAGTVVTWEEMTSSTFQFCANPDELTVDSPAPVRADASGRYPAPVPGQWKEV
jgi:predicted dehydrogenase